MTAYEKLKVMKVANWLIEQLLDCGDADFADRVLASIGNGENLVWVPGHYERKD